MKREHWKRAKDLISEAESLSSSGRQTFLDRECGDDAELRTLVDALLDATGPDPLGDLPPLPFKLIDETPPPEQIESYRLLHKLGQGGGGAVYLAEHTDDSFEQKVAIKILSTARDPNIAELFRKERQILADLHHHGICRLFSAGSLEDGRPYFIMEYIDGLTIAQCCEQRRLSESKRLKLFTKVCSAVEHAHRALVIHLDLKPSNILVDQDGEPKLLDFGIARILEPRQNGVEVHETEKRLFGTPRYASPELVDGKATTTVSDVYSLGVILFQLLAGDLPVASLQPREQAGELQEKAAQKFDGDLAAIVSKALQPDPEQRYRSVDRLAEDVQRLLDGRPVLARQQSLPYIVGKHLRRHPIAASFGAIFVLSVLAFSFVLARQQEQTARQRDRANEIATFLEEIFETSDPYEANDGDVTARELLARASTRIENLDPPEVRASLSETIGAVQVNLGLYEEAEPLLQESARLYREVAGADSADYASSLSKLGWLYHSLRNDGKAEETLRQSLAIQRTPETLGGLGSSLRLQGRLDESELLLAEAISLLRRGGANSRQDLAGSLANIGNLYISQGNYSKAEEAYSESLSIFQELWGEEHAQVAGILHNLAYAIEYQGNYQEAKNLYLQSLTMKTELLGADHPTVGSTANSLAALHVILGEYQEGEDLYQQSLHIAKQAFGDKHPQVARRLNNLANLLRTRGRFKEAEAMFRQALDLRREALGERHLEVAGSLNNLGLLAFDTARYSESERLILEALDIFREYYEEDHPNMLRVRHNQALALRALGKVTKAEEIWQADLETSRRKLGRDRLTAQFLRNLASSLAESGDLETAESYARESVEIFSEVLPGGNWRIADAESVLGGVLLKSDRVEEAHPLLEGSVPIIEAVRGVDAWEAKEASQRLARSHS